MKYIVKANGQREPYSNKKVINTCLRAGVSRKTAKKIADKIYRIIVDGDTTHRVYELIQVQLEKTSKKASAKAGLREAIANLGPRIFEMYAMKVLQVHGYQCKWNKIVNGRIIDHQIDVIAKKDADVFFVECKRHYNPHRYTGLGVALEVHARLEDLKGGYKDGNNRYNFTRAWLFTNSKFSAHAIRYAMAKQIKLTGWSSGEFSIQKLIESKKIYPVTMLKIDMITKQNLLKRKIITVQDIIQTRIKLPNWNQIVKDARDLMR